MPIACVSKISKQHKNKNNIFLLVYVNFKSKDKIIVTPIRICDPLKK